MTKVKFVCEVCGSEDVVKDAFARWCVETQTWVLSSTYDDNYCQACDCSCGLKEVSV